MAEDARYYSDPSSSSGVLSQLLIHGGAVKDSLEERDGAGNEGGDRKGGVVLMLNFSVPDVLPVVWRNARFRVCADGGANRIYDELPCHCVPLVIDGGNIESVRESYIPDAIVGDFDSIRSDVMGFYSSRGSTVIDMSHDQDTTDLQKCIQFILDSFAGSSSSSDDGFSRETDEIIVFGGIGGRMDHELGNLSVLYKYPELRIVLATDEGMLFLLPPGKNVLYVDRSLQGPSCGIVPLAGPAVCSSSGLKWELTNTRLVFGEFISTSNQIVQDKITIDTDVAVIWTIETRRNRAL